MYESFYVHMRASKLDFKANLHQSKDLFSRVLLELIDLGFLLVWLRLNLFIY